MELVTDKFENIHDYFPGRDRNDYIGSAGEQLIIEIFDSLGLAFEDSTGNHKPIDVLVPGFGIEIKTLASYKIPCICIKGRERKLKEQVCKELDIQGMTVAIKIIDEILQDNNHLKHKVDIRFKPGFKKFEVERMYDFSNFLWNVLVLNDLLDGDS